MSSPPRAPPECQTWPTPTRKMSKSTPQHAPGVIRMLDNADVIRPFELPDVVGNDVSLAIPRGLYLEFREPAAGAPRHRRLPRPQDPAEASATTAELRQSRQNSLPSGSVITMKPALIGGAGS